MKNFLFLLLIALLAVALLLFIFNPQVLQDIWLWIVGLVGPIAAGIKNGGQWLAGLFKGDKEEKKTVTNEVAAQINAQQNNAVSPEIPQVREADYLDKIKKLEERVSFLQGEVNNQLDEFNGVTITVLRYVHDEETTLGLLFIDSRYFCYTLEDTYRKVKVKGKTRIPSGTYNVDFLEYDTELTLKYRNDPDRQPWFQYHIHIQDIPNFTGVYIHSGANCGNRS